MAAAAAREAALAEKDAEREAAIEHACSTMRSVAALQLDVTCAALCREVEEMQGEIEEADERAQERARESNPRPARVPSAWVQS